MLGSRHHAGGGLPSAAVRTTALRTRIATTIGDVRPEDWDALVPATRGLCRHGVLHAVERGDVHLAANRTPLRCFYVLVFDAAGLAGVAALYCMTYAAPMLVDGVPRRVLAPLHRRFPRLLEIDVLECGSLISQDHTICIRPGAPRPAVLEAILAATEALGRELRVGMIAVRDFTARARAEVGIDAARMRSRGFAAQSGLPIATLELRWRSFEAYVDAMRTRYRRAVRQRIARARDVGMEVSRIAHYAPLAPQIERLYERVASRAALRREVLSRRFFDAFARGAPGTFALVAHRGEVVSGTLLCLADAEALHTLHIGLDYDENDDGLVYYNLFYAAIRHAIAGGAPRVDFGGMAYGAKVRLGCSLQAQTFYVKHANRALNALLLRAPDWPLPGATVETRHVFRRPEPAPRDGGPS